MCFLTEKLVKAAERAAERTGGAMRIRNAEILCVGTEILIGDIVNTNAAFISGRLAELGISQYYQAAVGDNPERLAAAINAALERCDLLIMSGGLGPTCDDLTKETAARCMGRELRFDAETMERIKQRFIFNCRRMTANNEKQAYIPEGSTVFPNNAGTAPGCAIEDFERGKIIIMLPGPPFEMKRMFDESVVPYLCRFTDSVFVSRNVCVFGMGESECESHLRELMESSGNPTVAPYCGEGEVRLRVTARGKDAAECGKLCDKTVELIRATPVGRYIYGIDMSLPKAVVDAYTKRGMTLSCAESCTGGTLAGKITGVSGASAVLGFGAVTYSNEAKHKLLGVKWETLDTYDAVSPETAVEMAAGVRALAGSDVGISVTGFAGPGGGNDRYPVGTVFVGVSSDKGTRAVELHIKGDRDRVRTVTVTNALSLALREITEE